MDGLRAHSEVEKKFKTIKVKSQNGSMILEVPKMLEAHPDIAFKIRK